jgi:hypothetical protein
MKKKTFSTEELIVHLYEAQEFIGETMDTEEGDVGHNHTMDMVYAIGQAIVEIDSPKEIRVYAVPESTMDKEYETYVDEYFIELAELWGLVWSLKGFQDACNRGDFFMDEHIIRFI